MLKIDLKNRVLEPTLDQTLKQAGLKETADLQDLIKRNSKVFFDEIGLDNAILLGTEIKPANDMVGDRIDLLAVDRDGTITVIELKRGSHKLQLLQGISYAAMIASWQPDKFEPLIQNRDDLDEGAKLNSTQRIVLVADAFEYEVLITAEWLVRKCEDVDIRCIRVQVAKDPATDAEYLTCEQVYAALEIADQAVRRRAQNRGESLPPQNQAEILKSTTNSDVYAFFNAQLNEQRKNVQFDEKYKSLRFVVESRIAWSVTIRRSFASVWHTADSPGTWIFGVNCSPILNQSRRKMMGARYAFISRVSRTSSDSWMLTAKPPPSNGKATREDDDLDAVWMRRRAVAVGIPVARHPPHRSVRALLSAYGSYLGCMAANRSDGQGCSMRGAGNQYSASLPSQFQLRRWRWLRWRSCVRHSRVNRSRKVRRRSRFPGTA